MPSATPAVSPAASTPLATDAPVLHIDFVSDVVCPWCAIGLHSLLKALDELGDSLGPVALRFQPFELNPQLGPDGEDLVKHLQRKYGMSAEQVHASHQNLSERAAAVGFVLDPVRRTRTWNTFDAHRLLHWAALHSNEAALALKKGLLAATFTHGENPGNGQVLVREAMAAGLNPAEAARVLDSDLYADDVRQHQLFWQRAGIHSVPAIIVNQRHLIQGGQPPEVFVQALRQIFAEG